MDNTHKKIIVNTLIARTVKYCIKTAVKQQNCHTWHYLSNKNEQKGVNLDIKARQGNSSHMNAKNSRFFYF
jgi:hypothetical protein